MRKITHQQEACMVYRFGHKDVLSWQGLAGSQGRGFMCGSVVKHIFIKITFVD